MAEDNLDMDVQELDDETLETVSGGRGRKLLCPRGTRKVCGTKGGKYGCWCEPNAPAPKPDSQPDLQPEG